MSTSDVLRRARVRENRLFSVIGIIAGALLGYGIVAFEMASVVSGVTLIAVLTVVSIGSNRTVALAEEAEK